MKLIKSYLEKKAAGEAVSDQGEFEKISNEISEMKDIHEAGALEAKIGDVQSNIAL